ncbi:MAG TPA: Grx4 family monothiol glutaredoxin [Candidatus Omnitrophota bacterium]|nr:Grx4 family monothiol glutaredoxin [Candidatus Omnitrophota bacterium]
MDDVTKQRIVRDIKENKVLLYMKGTPEDPQCGFSAQAVNILRTYPAPLKTFNVFDDEKIREGVKEFSGWPKIPQLFVDGKFIGGCDAIVELHSNGELAKVLGKKNN